MTGWVVDQGMPGRGHSTTYAMVIKSLPDDVAEATRLRASATSSGSDLITIAYVVECPRPGMP